MRPTYALALAAALTASTLLAGCRDDKPESTPSVTDVFPHLVLPPSGSRLVARSGSSDALQLTFESPAGVDDVAGYYREELSQGVWTLKRDGKDARGVYTFYAEQKGPPLWVRVAPSRTGTGSQIVMGGAIVGDSAAATGAGGSSPQDAAAGN